MSQYFSSIMWGPRIKLRSSDSGIFTGPTLHFRLAFIPTQDALSQGPGVSNHFSPLSLVTWTAGGHSNPLFYKHKIPLDSFPVIGPREWA